MSLSSRFVGYFQCIDNEIKKSSIHAHMHKSDMGERTQAEHVRVGLSVPLSCFFVVPLGERKEAHWISKVSFRMLITYKMRTLIAWLHFTCFSKYLVQKMRHKDIQTMRENERKTGGEGRKRVKESGREREGWTGRDRHASTSVFALSWRTCTRYAPMREASKWHTVLQVLSCMCACVFVWLFVSAFAIQDT